MPDDSLRNAAQKHPADPVSPMTADHNEIRGPVARYPDNGLRGITDGHELGRVRRNGHSRRQRIENLQNFIVGWLRQLLLRGREA